jgi:hypothetical protein
VTAVAVAVRRVLVALVVVISVLSTSRRAEADDREPAPSTEVTAEPKAEQSASHLQVSTSMLMTFGSFVGIPVVRGGLGVEARTRYLSGHALLALGRTPNGLGAHRIEVGGNLTSPMGWFRASIGPHIGYAMLVRTTLRSQFRRIDPLSTRVVLVDRGNRVLGTFAERLSAAAGKRLEKLGVEVRLGNGVDRIDAEGVVVAGERIASRTVIWTAGVTPSPAGKRSPMSVPPIDSSDPPSPASRNQPRAGSP